MTPRVWCEICGNGPDDTQAGREWDGVDAWVAAEQHAKRHGNEGPFEDADGMTVWVADAEGEVRAFDVRAFDAPFGVPLDVRAAWSVNYIATPKKKETP